jgi:hypothetical protein
VFTISDSDVAELYVFSHAAFGKCYYYLGYDAEQSGSPDIFKELNCLHFRIEKRAKHLTIKTQAVSRETPEDAALQSYHYKNLTCNM